MNLSPAYTYSGDRHEARTREQGCSSSTYRSSRALNSAHPVKQVCIRPRECRLYVQLTPANANSASGTLTIPGDEDIYRSAWSDHYYSSSTKRPLTISVINSLLSLKTFDSIPRCRLNPLRATTPTHRFVTLPAGSPPAPPAEGLAEARGASCDVICSIATVTRIFSGRK